MEGSVMETRTGQRKGSDVVLELLHALEEKDFSRAATFLSNDFTFSGPTPKPIDSKAFIDVHRQLFQAIPDWRFNFNVIKEDDNEVTGRVHITGMHTRDLTLPMVPNLGTVHATGKKISLPEEKVHIKMKGSKINRFNVEVTPKGGVMGLLAQIGVDVHELA
jgi:predicted ester cyclase